MIALNYIVMIDGVQFPVEALAATWSTASMTESFTFSLPSSPAAEGILPSSHVHLWSLESDRKYYERSVAHIPRDNLYGEGAWYAESMKTLGAVKQAPIYTDKGVWSPLELSRDLARYGYMYRGGGEVIKVTGTESSQAGSVTVVVGGYSHIYSKILAIQLLDGVGAFSDLEVKAFGQSEEVFPGDGRKAFASGIMDLFSDVDDDLILGLKKIITKYAEKVSPMWETRIPMDRLPNQLISIEKDTSPAKIMNSPEFEKILRAILVSRQGQLVSLAAVFKDLLALIGYAMIPIPSPAYFPLAPAPDQIKIGKKKISDAVTRQIRPNWSATVYVSNIIFGPMAVDPNPPPNLFENSTLTWSSTDPESGYAYYNPPTTGPIYGPTQPYKVKRYIRDRAKVPADIEILADKSVRITFTLPEDVRGGPHTYTHVMDLESMELSHEFQRASNTRFASLAQSTDMTPGRTEDVTGSYDYFPLSELVKFGSTTWNQIENEGKYAEYQKYLDIGVVFYGHGAGTSHTPAKYEPILRDDIPDDFYPNWVSRLNTYAILPKLWWALFPACNVVYPHQIRSWSRGQGGQNRLTRLIARSRPGRSGSRSTFVDNYPAPSPGGLDQIMQSSVKDYDAENIKSYEYIGGIQPDIWYADVLSKSMGDTSWKTFLKSKVNMEFWSRRLRADTASITVDHDTSVVTGAPLLFFTERASKKEGSSSLSPEAVSLRNRLKNLLKLLAMLDTRAVPPSQGMMRYLLSVWNNLVFKEFCLKQAATGTKYSGVEVDWSNLLRLTDPGKVDLLLLQNSYAMLGYTFRKHPEISLEPDDIVRMAGGKMYQGVYPRHNANISYWTPDTALGQLGLTKESVGELEVSYAAFSQIFSGKSIVITSRKALGKIIDYVKSKGPSAERDAVKSCNAAVREDRELVKSLIEKTRAKLREIGAPPSGGSRKAYIGYVAQITESLSQRTTQASKVLNIALTHVREIGQDLDYNGLKGDDLESIVAFGEDGYMDERYARENIGEKVYKLIYGCGSGLDVPGVKQRIKENREMQASSGVSIEGFPENLSDLVGKLQSEKVCGRDYLKKLKEGDSDSFVLESEIAEGIMGVYDDLGGSAESKDETTSTWKARPYLNIGEAYLGKNVAWSESNIDYKVEITENLEGVHTAEYPEDDTYIQGFFATSFVGPGEGRDEAEKLHPRPKDGEDPLKLAEEEVNMLLDRQSRVRNAADFYSNGSIS